MPAFSTQASIQIDANIETVRAVLTDFHSWPIWSPWLYVEPNTHVEYHGSMGSVGAGNTWLGDKTGEGKITLTRDMPSRLEMDLDFIKPFKSHADVYFDLHSVDQEKTQVTWGMDSTLPIFMFWMTGTMVAMIRADYRRGLLMLKDHIELGHIPSNASFDGVSHINEMPYVGLHGETTMEEIGDAMSAQLATLAKATAAMQPQEVFSIYNRLDMKANTMDYTAAIGVGNRQNVEAPLVRGKRAACKALKVTHVGPYRHLANAWFMAISEQRHAKHKLVSTSPAFEIYRNSPVDTAENDLITEIYIPIK